MSAQPMPLPRPDMGRFLGGLKDFQRDTVEYVFRRLYTDRENTRRFLVADEVGLGKTMVARGVIARTIDHLWDKVGRIDIVYVCSNADIAEQNIHRLRLDIPGQAGFNAIKRVTMLPARVHGLKQNRVNFIALTPGTSFDLKSNTGRKEERALLYWLLHAIWGVRGSGPRALLQAGAGKESFIDEVDAFRDRYDIDPDLTAAFADALGRRIAQERRESRPDLRSRFFRLSRRFKFERLGNVEEAKPEARHLVGELRAILAATCIQALEPDLVILDEFQRFKHLLRGDDDSGELARKLFDYADETSEARVLLLSATPYKMYTLYDEAGSDHHYEDFLATLHFLFGNERRTAEIEELLKRYNSELYSLGDGPRVALDRLRNVKADLESHLRQVMVRTERLAVSGDRNGMLTQVTSGAAALEPGDIQAYLATQRVAEALEQRDVVEYWKTAPYLLNLMDDYQLKRSLKSLTHGSEKEVAVARALGDARSYGALFPRDQWLTYDEVAANNPRLRTIISDVVNSGSWQLLWMPPALPHYALGGPYGHPAVAHLTKKLIFSAWRVAPKAIASMLSYEAERRMIRASEESPQNVAEVRSRRPRLLRFNMTDGRPSSVGIVGLLYPSSVLAREVDPQRIAHKLLQVGEEANGGGMRGGEQEAGAPPFPTLDAVLARAQLIVEELLARMGGVDAGNAPGPPDESWYWAAPILLDLTLGGEGTRAWWGRRRLASIWTQGTEDEEEGESPRWSSHVERARKLIGAEITLGKPPADLARVVAQMAIAAPGTVTLRALRRVIPGVDDGGDTGRVARDEAARLAWAFRSLFNLPESTALLRGLTRSNSPWRTALEYCANGGLQAVMDEYVHIVYESSGAMNQRTEEAAATVAEAMSGAITLRTSSVSIDDVHVDSDAETIALERFTTRTRYALWFGDQTEEGGQAARKRQVRDAFNSPFWPFVLATTSAGQEGLDFHPYCHAVVHWDLPSNPVDLEQREGRVHRYKGHAVRKNLARRHGQSALSDSAESDPWAALFERGCEDRQPGDSDLVPYWVYPLEDGAKIERHVPLDLESGRGALGRAEAVAHRVSDGVWTAEAGGPVGVFAEAGAGGRVGGCAGGLTD